MNKYILILLAFISSSIFLISCEDVPEPYGSDGAPGFSVSYIEDSTEIILTKNIDETITASVAISGKWLVNSKAEFDRIEIYKVLLDRQSNEISRSLALRDVAIGDSVPFSITSSDELFDGLGVTPDEITIGSYFVFEVVGIYPAGNEITITDKFSFEAEYVAFCEIPELETGVWIVTNSNTGYTKEIEILWDEEAQLYGFTDFGIDWSFWNDMWFGAQFALRCPGSDSDPIFIDLTGWGVWETGYFPDMLGDDGVTMENRQVRYLPYRYQLDSPVGYYDEATGNLVFENVNVTDAWWDMDKHEGVSMVFKKK